MVPTIPDKIFGKKWSNSAKLEGKENFGICFWAYRNLWTLDASVLGAVLWMLDCGRWTVDAGL